MPDQLTGLDSLLSNIHGADATVIVLVLIAVWLITRPKEKFSKEILTLALKGIFFLAGGSLVASVIFKVIDSWTCN
jgi:chromate transport protein ChrA